MIDSDKKQFMTEWNNTRLYYDKNKLSADVVKLVYLDLQQYQLADIITALSIHRRRSKFRPVADDILEILQAVRPGDAFPGADEAWAMCPKGGESKTVTVFDEMLEADAIASECLPDKIATRMAFKSAYERIINTAIISGKNKPQWRMSLGHDVDGREAGVMRAVGRGLISPAYASNVMPNIPLIEFEARLNPALEHHAHNSKSTRQITGAGGIPAVVEHAKKHDELSTEALDEIDKISKLLKGKGK